MNRFERSFQASPQGAGAEEGLDLQAYWRMVIRGWYLFLGVGLLFGAMGFAISLAQTPIYQATAKILVAGNRTPGPLTSGDIQASQQLAQSLGDLVTARPISEQVSEILGPETGRGGGGIDVRTPRSLVEITGSHPNPQMAADIANTTAQVFMDDFLRRQLSQIAQFRAALSQYGIEQDASLIAAQAATLTTLNLVEDARPPGRPSSPRTRFNTFLGVLAGLLLGGLLVLLRDQLNDKIQSATQLADATGFPVLGSIHRHQSRGGSGPLLSQPNPDRSAVESYKFLQTNLEFAASGVKSLKAILITSSEPSEGKTTVATNLATSIANEGGSVILVGADLRKPSLDHSFDLYGARGLTHLLQGVATVDEVLAQTEVPGLRILPAGLIPPDPPLLLRSPMLRQAIEELKNRADFVLIDSPPLLLITDSLLLTRVVDGALLVVEPNHTRRSTVRRAADMLRETELPMIGAILNKQRRSGDSGFGYYYYYYSENPEDGGNGRDNQSRWSKPLRKLKMLLRRGSRS